MTAVLGFESLSMFALVLEARGVTDVSALDVAQALARHSPRGMLRFRRHEPEEGTSEFVEVDAQGYVGEPRIGDDLDDIEAVTAGLYASWPYGDDSAPTFVARIVLPQTGWDWGALSSEPAIIALGATGSGWFGTTEDTYDLVDRDGPVVLDVASVYDIVLSYG